MKTILVLLRRLILGLAVMALVLVLLWKSGLAVRLATQAAVIASAGRVAQDPAQAPPAELALVPGTSLRGELLRQRMRAAAALYHAGKVKRLLLSGDGRSANYNEPRAMHRMARELGVPDTALTEDPGGLTTYDSVRHALDLVHGAAFTIVSQPAHCRRALLLARGMGADAHGLAAPGGAAPDAVSPREEQAALRAVLDLMGLRGLTSQWKNDGHITVAGVRVAAL